MSRYSEPEPGEWIRPKPTGYKLACCDCGLVHRLDFRIEDGHVEFRVFPARRETGQVRRWQTRRGWWLSARSTVGSGPRRDGTVAVTAPKGASATLADIEQRYSRVEMTQELREDSGVTGLSAELLKYHAERKLIHEMLTAAGIPEVSAGEGERVCLIGRIGIALDRLRP
jgi:hypothetical protein